MLGGKADEAPDQLLEVALESLKRAEALLESPSPSGLDRCAEALGAAIAALRQRPNQSGMPRDTRPAANVLAVRRAVLRCAALLNKAADFRMGWSAMAASMCAGYTALGAPAQTIHPARVWVRG